MSDAAIDRVIAGGYCIGCGACAAAAPQDFAVAWDGFGRLQAQALTAPEARARDVSALCPMTGTGRDEDAVAAALWPDLPVHPEIGRHGLCAVGWVEEGAFRARGSSGGMLSWLAHRLLAEGHVAAIFHVVPGDAGTLFRYRVSRTADALAEGAKSRYHPVTLVDAVAAIRAEDGPVALVALPCFVKAMRALAADDPALGAKIPFMLGLVCGHLKSRAFAELLAWQHGLAPERLGGIDFRVKIEGRPTWSYGFEAESADGAERVAAPMAETFGGDWGLGLFKHRACDYCDDVLAECADAAVGDAWLPGAQDDWRGTNVVVARHPALVDLIDRGRREGALALDTVDPDTVALSQVSGLRHRREGLAFRLAETDRAGRWRPQRRVAPSRALDRGRRRIYALRVALLDRSHTAFAAARAAGDLDVFRRAMAPLVARYAACYAPPRPTRLRRWAGRIARFLMPGAARRALKRALGR